MLILLMELHPALMLNKQAACIFVESKNTLYVLYT